MIYFPFLLDLQKFGILGKYTLTSVVNHRGSLNGGHYYTYSKCGEFWYIFNDDVVTKINENHVVSNYAFLLFYERV
ncbi:hypothetical protein EIN_387120 [Entamoeba invadens IP1]|uniref:USP domain-containing protein n=1 Tax=Entamoeba invadens IP1 TaxID=370355 RepID=A0A0A1UAD2_ENTIV|nr:hypothetical protein EIN_387120 [Entamoeba invadens IP1]ELP91998.1 hypothetical protein EIN_387120 [Entamoeba invadens IP1]|eukprot:XP_004258769.1 hypothetical protein EIN_387120 [Entamoeba invadens IP1]